MIDVTRIDEEGEKVVPIHLEDIASIGLDYKGCTINMTNGKSFRIKESEKELDSIIREEIRGK